MSKQEAREIDEDRRLLGVVGGCAGGGSLSLPLTGIAFPGPQWPDPSTQLSAMCALDRRERYPAPI